LPSYGGTSGWHHCWQKKNPSKDLDHSDPQKAACHHFQKIAPFDSHADVEHVELGLLSRFLQTLTTLSEISPKAKDRIRFHIDEWETCTVGARYGSKHETYITKRRVVFWGKL